MLLSPIILGGVQPFTVNRVVIVYRILATIIIIQMPNFFGSFSFFLIERFLWEVPYDLQHYYCCCAVIL